MTRVEVGGDDLRERLRRLEDEAALRSLAQEYCFGLDRRELDRFAAIWHPTSGVWALDIGIEPEGADAIIAFTAEQLLPSFRSTHHWTSNHRIALDGDRATGVCDVVSVVVGQDGERILTASTYADEYERWEGRWVIRRRDAAVHLRAPIAEE